jgi:hypothetical protein
MADFHTDLHSINKLVHHSKSKEGARKKFHNMHGISVPKHTAELMFNDAAEKKFSVEETQASFTAKVQAHYRLSKN